MIKYSTVGIGINPNTKTLYLLKKKGACIKRIRPTSAANTQYYLKPFNQVYKPSIKYIKLDAIKALKFYCSQTHSILSQYYNKNSNKIYI